MDPKATSLLRSPRLRHLLRRVGLGALGLYVLYLFAANVFLGFHLLDRLATSDDGTVELRTERAWSLFPGHASVRGFVLRLDNDDLQLRIEVARASTWVGLFRLVRKEVALSDIDATGVSFRLRMRVDAIPPEDRERIEAYPDIPGALGPPLRSAAKKVPKTRPEDAWHVAIADAKIGIDEVWIQEYRLTGAIGAGGGFALWPGKDFVLAPSALTIRDGRVRVGAHEITSDLQVGDGVATITPVRLADTGGTDVLRYLTASARGSSTLQDTSFLEVYPGVPKVHTAPARTQFEARFAEGRFVTGTTAMAEVPDTTVRLPGLALGASAIVTLSVPRAGDIELAARSRSGWVTIDALPSTKKDPWRAGDTSVRQMLHVAVGDPFAFGTGAYRGSLRTPTLGWFEDLAALGSRVHGSATTRFDFVRDDAGKITGPFVARLEDAVVAGDTLAVGLTSTTNGTLTLQPNPKDGVAFTAVRVVAPSAFVEAAGHSRYTTWLRVDAPSITFAVAPKLAVRAAADAAAGTGGLVAGVVESRAGLVLGPIAAHFIDGAGMSVRAGLAVADRDVTVELPRAKVGSVDGKGFWMRRGNKSTLALVLEDPPLSVGIRIGDGIPVVLPTVGDDWLAAQRR